MKGIFITGTDTGVGKTLIVAGIAKMLLEKGVRVGIIKPISSGGIPSQDIIYLQKCLSYKNIISPIQFKLPLAPYAAAKLENKSINFKKIFKSLDNLSKNCDFVIAEGIGGAMVPILKNYFVTDLIKDFKLPVIILSRPGLGTLNHTFMTIEVLEKRKIKILGVIINGFKKIGVPEKTNSDIIEEISGYPILAKIKWDKQYPKNIKLLADVLKNSKILTALI
ncbi:MAG: dethiobiotin synthase [Candidatus Firestonebacteria bacterium]